MTTPEQLGATESFFNPPRSQALTVGDLLRRAADESPAYPALRTAPGENGEQNEWTYAQLLADSEHCAHRLLEVFDVGDHVAIWADNRPEWVILQFGAALAGLTLVTVNPGFKASEAKYVLAQSRAVGCFAAASYRGVPLADTARGFQAELSSLRHVFDLDFWQDFLGDRNRGTPTELPEVRPDDPVLIQYTSGTTGFPKGAVLLHGRLTDNAEQVALRAGLEENSVWLAPLPLFHAGGCVVAVLGAATRRSTIVLMDAWSAKVALELVESERVQIINAVPAMLIGMMQHEDLESRDLTSLRFVIAGASTVSAEVVRDLERLLKVQVFIIFGQTECGPVSTMTNPGDRPEDKQNTVGTVLPGFEVKIVDPESGLSLGVDELGEFVVRGNTMAGYFDNTEATEAAFDEQGWVHTGDLCAIDERGYVRVEGRLRDMIIRGGENIYPREVEEALLSLPAITDAAVVGLPDKVLGEVVGAFVVPAPNETFDEVDAVETLRARLARYKVPQHWIVVDELPRTATGKIQKFLLRDQHPFGDTASGNKA